MTDDVRLIVECRRLATLAGARALEADAAANDRHPPRGEAVHREDATQYRQMAAALNAAAAALAQTPPESDPESRSGLGHTVRLPEPQTGGAR